MWWKVGKHRVVQDRAYSGQGLATGSFPATGERYSEVLPRTNRLQAGGYTAFAARLAASKARFGLSMSIRLSPAPAVGRGQAGSAGDTLNLPRYEAETPHCASAGGGVWLACARLGRGPDSKHRVFDEPTPIALRQPRRCRQPRAINTNGHAVTWLGRPSGTRTMDRR